ncbi:leishmanolysin-related zinc metalloendopeptidase (plasmid) [Aliisedimentitalea scapharcae]|uniref:Leishmanolysin-related zinc metalloendopeptidase n=1 Tax=Aliisedimentitalea scapharcae TaxID=1524259 RepID=A0ABZ2Y327_9RHOB
MIAETDVVLVNLGRDPETTRLDQDITPWGVDDFEFVPLSDLEPIPVDDQNTRDDTTTPFSGDMAADRGNGRDDTGPASDDTPPEDIDADPAPTPVALPETPPAPTNNGRPTGETPGTPRVTPPSIAPGDDNAEYGRDPGATPDVPPVTGPVADYVSGGPAASSYNVAIEFIGTWTTSLQAAFTEAADYLSTIILADIPDAVVDGVVVDDITITATLEGIDGIGGTLGSAGPRMIRNDGTYLSATGAMTFDSADAQDQFDLGNWETIVLHEMMHALGFGTLWSLMGLTSGSVAGGDMRFTGANATDVYQTEFSDIASADSGSLLGVPVETDGGPGTAGGHWDETEFDTEIMTGYVDTNSFVSLMTIAALEDMGYDTVFDNPYSATDLNGPTPGDPLLDLFV